MFSEAFTIDKTFRHIRLYSILWFLGCGALSVFMCSRTFTIMQQAHNRIYILSSGKVMEAVAANRRDNLEVEARDHIRTFHEYFFTLDPDEKVINTNITHALYLADASAKRLHDNLKENGYYAGIISGNISQQIVIDSVAVDIGPDLLRFHCWATLRIIRPTSIVTRSLITKGLLRNVSRSDNNPHGFLIEAWTTVENKDVRVEAR